MFHFARAIHYLQRLLKMINEDCFICIKDYISSIEFYKATLFLQEQKFVPFFYTVN